MPPPGLLMPSSACWKRPRSGIIAAAPPHRSRRLVSPWPYSDPIKAHLSEPRSNLGAAGPAPKAAALTAEAKLLRHGRALLGVGGRGERMVARQVPAPQILGSLQSVPSAEVSSQRFSSEAAFEADDVVMLHRSANWYSRSARRRRRCRFSKIPQCLLHRGDQGRQLIWRQRMIADIAGDNLGDGPQIAASFRIFGTHDCFLPAA